MTELEFVAAVKEALAGGISMKGVAINRQLLGKCPTCRKKILSTEFKDELSVREFCISGMCQECQDEVFC